MYGMGMNISPDIKVFGIGDVTIPNKCKMWKTLIILQEIRINSCSFVVKLILSWGL